MPTQNKGIYRDRRAYRKQIAVWHANHDVTRAETARHFGCSEYLVSKALQENGVSVPCGGPNSRTAMRARHIAMCVQGILEIADRMDICTNNDRLVLKILQKRLVSYRDSLEAGEEVKADFFRSTGFPFKPLSLEPGDPIV